MAKHKPEPDEIEVISSGAPVTKSTSRISLSWPQSSRSKKETRLLFARRVAYLIWVVVCLELLVLAVFADLPAELVVAVLAPTIAAACGATYVALGVKGGGS